MTDHTLSCYHAVKRTANDDGEISRPPVAPLYTDVAFVGDRSGSMASTGGGSQEGAKEYVKKQADAAKKLNCRLGFHIDFLTFDDEIESPFSGDAGEVTDSVLEMMFQAMEPRGSTKFYDAIIESIQRQIKRLEEKFSTLPPCVQDLVLDQPWLFAASCSPMTDGWDNASKPGSGIEVKTVLQNYQHNYSATAMVLAANRDAGSLAELLGLANDAGLQMGTTGDECRAAMNSAAASQLRQATSGGGIPPPMFTQLERETSCSMGTVHHQPRQVSCPPSFARPRLTRSSNVPSSQRTQATNMVIPPPPATPMRGVYYQQFMTRPDGGSFH